MPDLTIFDRIPSTSDLFSNNGRPGVTYALIHTHNMAKASKEGWVSLSTQNLIEVQGPNGISPVVIMAKGEPITGASLGAQQPELFVDEQIYQETGHTSGAIS